MTSEINNAWITLPELRKGVSVQRAFAGLHPMVLQPNNEGKSEVLQCIVYYWERELYPNGEAIKTELKNYVLQDLPETTNDAEGWRMEPRAVLTGFVITLGYPGIINPARDTLDTIATLPLDAPDGYPLHLNTREKIAI